MHFKQRLTGTCFTVVDNRECKSIIDLAKTETGFLSG